MNKLDEYPARFSALPVTESVETFSLLQREWFLKAFLTVSQKQGDSASEKQLQVSFIKGGEEYLERLLPDFEHAKEVNLLLCGDEAPADLMLEQKKVIERGGLIRTIVQRNTKETQSLHEARKKLGQQVRVHAPVYARFLIFDKKIAYVMSYDPSNFIKSTGVRFEYAPLAELMNRLYMQYWEHGKEL